MMTSRRQICSRAPMRPATHTVSSTVNITAGNMTRRQKATEKNTAARAMENTMRNPGVTSRKRVRKISIAVILPATQTMKIQNTGIETGITENKHSMTGHKNITTKNGISHYGYAVFSSISFCLLASAASFSCSHPCNCGKIEKNQRNGGIIICL